MKVEYTLYRMGFVRVTKEAAPYHYLVEDGYVEYTGVKSVETCVSGALVITDSADDVFIHAPGTWVHYYTTQMEDDL